jgi:hypothetical protein
MRTYDLLYRSVSDSWLIIFKDSGDDSWSVFLDGIEDKATATHIRNAMNRDANN